MVNNMENNTSLNSVSDLENSKNKLEMMRYRVNSLSYMFGFLAILLSVLAAFVCLNSMEPTKAYVILKIFLNIIVLLAGFLCCEKSKSYSTKGSIALIVLGVICVLRIFWIPVQLFTENPNLVGQVMENTRHATAWLPSSGVFRGFLAIVLLSGSAASFIFAGIVGYIRSKKLITYLDSIAKI